MFKNILYLTLHTGLHIIMHSPGGLLLPLFIICIIIYDVLHSAENLLLCNCEQEAMSAFHDDLLYHLNLLAASADAALFAHFCPFFICTFVHLFYLHIFAPFLFAHFCPFFICTFVHILPVLDLPFPNCTLSECPS